VAVNPGGLQAPQKPSFAFAFAMLFSNIFAAAALVSTAFAAPSDKETRANRKLKFFGINESGAEFGEKNFPGVYGKDYTWYDTKTIDQFLGQGMNMFRLNFRKLNFEYGGSPR
jgi:endoglucanase